MLLELAIRNFAIIRDLRVRFDRGLQAMTGETGAGKSIIIDALGAVLGSRISSEFVRSEEQRAWVEAVFDLASITERERLEQLLHDLGIDHDDDTLILTRDIRDSGRSTARINGRTVPVRYLAQVGALLVDIHGQSEHLSLLRPAEHLPMLDRFAGVVQERTELSEMVREFRRTRDEIERIRSSERERAQRIDLLRFQVEEIDTAALQPDEQEQLDRERKVLANAERLRETARQAYELLEGNSDYSATDSPAVLDGLRTASSLLDQLAEVDQHGASEQANQIREALFLLEEWVPSVRSYAEAIEADPARLEVIEERITTLRELQRKYGATVPEILTYRDAAAAELDELDISEEQVDQLQHRLEQLRHQIGQHASLLSSRRQEAARSLEASVEQAIAEMNMGGSLFRVGFSEQTGDDSAQVERDGSLVEVVFDPTGIDRVEFLIAPNPGEAPRPLARIASGGETARLMLALKSILSDVDATPTLVFDEIDVGVGGRSGQPVGERLWSLGRNHQVIVISHLPQIAAFADHHVKITKLEQAGRTETGVVDLVGEERTDEIAAMLDGVPVTEASRRNAIDMLERADRWKHGRVKV